MDLHIVFVAVAAANLAVTIWLIRLLIPILRTLRKVMAEVDRFDFDRLTKQFLNGEMPLAESISIKTTENKEEGYREISIIRTYKKPLDPKEIQEGFVRQMAKEMQ